MMNYSDDLPLPKSIQLIPQARNEEAVINYYYNEPYYFENPYDSNEVPPGLLGEIVKFHAFSIDHRETEGYEGAPYPVAIVEDSEGFVFSVMLKYMKFLGSKEMGIVSNIFKISESLPEENRDIVMIHDSRVPSECIGIGQFKEGCSQVKYSFVDAEKKEVGNLVTRWMYLDWYKQYMRVR